MTLRAALNRWMDAPDPAIPLWTRPPRFMVRLLVRSAEQLVRDKAPLMAAAVTYRTVFALVPVLVVSLVMLRFFLGSDAIGQGLDALLKQFGLTDLAITGAEAAEGQPATVAQWLESVVQRAEGINFGAIGAVGALLLIYAAVSLLVQIEQCFNVIYAAPSGRKLTARLTSYWTMLTLGPLGIITSLTLGSRLGAAVQPLGGVGANLADALLSLGISWLILLASYLIIPNARVKLRPAAIGAIFAAVLWELGKQGFRTYLGFSTGYAALYGSLGLVPVFFLWVYLTWLIVLFGLEVARALQTLTDRYHIDPASPAPADPACAMAMLARAARHFADSRDLNLTDAAEAAGLSPRHAEILLERLQKRGFLHALEHEGDEPRFALARAPERIRVSDVAEAVGPGEADPAHAVRRAMLDRHDGMTLHDVVLKAGPAEAP